MPGFAGYLLITRIVADPLGVPDGVRPDLRVALLSAAGLALTVILAGAAKVRGEHLAEIYAYEAGLVRPGWLS